MLSAIRAILGQVFDQEYYLQTNADVVREKVDPLDHFIFNGWSEGRDPHILFDIKYYLNNNPDVAGAAVNPLEHFLTAGAAQLRDPHPLINMRMLDFEAKTAGVSAHPRELFIALTRGLLPDNIKHHNWFDSVYYGEQLERRAISKPLNISKLQHYLMRGFKKTVNPHLFFDEEFYRATHNPIGPGLLDYINRSNLRDTSTHPFLGTSLGAPFMFRGLSLHTHPEEMPKFCEINSGASLFGVTPGSAAEFLVRWCFSCPIELPSECPSSPTETSFIILNFNKPFLTIQTVVSLLLHTDLKNSEIIVADNGSSHENLRILRRFLPKFIRIISIEANRFFPEGNNIAAEAAQGKYICFLNNDVMFTHGWFDPLLKKIRNDPECGAIGPFFHYPDGRPQEFGAIVAECGAAIQRYKGHAALVKNTLPEYDIVDYCSAATLLMRLDDFKKLGGFDYIYEPAYYEDSDLCLKLRLLDKRVFVSRESVIYHVENATSSDASNGLRLNSIVPINRLKFSSRWQHAIRRAFDSDSTDTLRKNFISTTNDQVFNNSSRQLAIYTPYQVIAGGGERYLFSLANLAWHKFGAHITFITPDRYSSLRYASALRDLGLPQFPYNVDTLSNIDKPYDASIIMANELMPPIKGLGKNNLYHCQFPFPMSPRQFDSRLGNLPTYKRVVVNSEFTKSHYTTCAREAGLITPPVEILFPPVGDVPPYPLSGTKQPYNIISIGRFFVGGHQKGHSSLIRVFSEIQKYIPEAQLNLCGALQGGPDNRDYLYSLMDQAKGLRVNFHVNVTSSVLGILLEQAEVFWSATGLGSDISDEPEKAEHFGISIVEAMARSCIPFAYYRGGPQEIIESGVSGHFFKDMPELAKKTRYVLQARSEIEGFAARAHARAKMFDRPNYEKVAAAILTKTFGWADPAHS